MQSIRLAAVAVAALALGATSVNAQVRSGSRLNFSGTVDAVDLGAPGLVLTFDQGTVRTVGGNTGDFAFLNETRSGTTGAIRSLRVGAGPQPMANFLTLGGYTFDLRYVPSGTYGQDECYVYPEAGQRCSPFQLPAYVVSPIDLVNRASGDPEAPFSSLATFRLRGTVMGPTGDVASYFFGTIAAEFDRQSFQEALGAVEQTGLQGLRFNATFVAASTVPEPSTYALAAVGLAGIAGAARLRRRAPTTR